MSILRPSPPDGSVAPRLPPSPPSPLLSVLPPDSPPPTGAPSPPPAGLSKDFPDLSSWMPTLMPSPSSLAFFGSSFAGSAAFAGASSGSSSSNLIPSSAAFLRRFFSSIFASSSADRVLYFGLLWSAAVSPASAAPDNCIASCSFFNFAALAAFSFSTCALTAAINASLWSIATPIASFQSYLLSVISSRQELSVFFHTF